MKYRTYTAFQKYFYMALALVLFCTLAPAQNLSGPTPVDNGETVTYTYNDGTLNMALTWSVTGGTLVSSSSLGTSYTAEVLWPNIGTQRIEALGAFGTLLEGMDVVVEHAPPPNAVTLGNYVHSIAPRVATTANVDAMDNDKKIESITYFDGLGRPSQSIGIRAGGLQQDIITHIGYDAFGRQAREYLPYSSATDIGSFRADALAATLAHYDAAAYDEDFPGMDMADINPYSEKLFDGSPLNRTTAQGAPGKDWKLGNGHEIEMGYLTNGATEVRYYRVSLVKNTTNNVVTYIPTLAMDGHYGPNELYRTVTRDENHDGTASKDHTTEEFTNKQGQVVLKRTYDNGTSHDTYYVYDHYGNLSFVLPPKAEPHADKPDTTELAELCYQYVYDDLNRLVEKKIPGKGWEYIIYNKLDRPIMTQDTNLREQNRWLFTKYDVFGRVAYTGMKTSSSTRHHFQSLLDSSAAYEEKVATGTGYRGTYYTSNAYPDTFDEVHTINYYDDYNFNIAGGSPQTAYGVTPITNAKGLATGSKVRVLGTDDWITTVTHYDKKSRPIYVYSKNAYLDTEDRVKSQLTFDGMATETTTVRQKTGQLTLTIVDKYSYDHANRLKSHLQKVNGAALDELIVHNNYDDLGQLQTKGVGGKQNAPDQLQYIDYSYSVRGWLRAINDISDFDKDLFAFEINYNTQDHGGTPLYNGNIAETQWWTKKDNTLRWYRYGYDALNRINGATSHNGDYDLENVTYDKNGNITNLVRKGHVNAQATTFGVMDNLVYTYETKSNRLEKVLDNGNDNYGFKDGVDDAKEYAYDANGNMAEDDNKGITRIDYNHLNLPTLIYLPSGTISYIYDATGIKQKKIVSTGTTTEYAGNFIYEDGSFKMMSHPEGYAELRPNAKIPSFDYVYQYRDHLGNVRLTYADSDGDGSIDAQTEIIEENNYYPFGLKHKGYNDVVSANVNSIASKLKTYQGQEFTEELGYNMHEYKFRHYDAAIARFVAIDPLASDYTHNSTYAFSENRVIDAREMEGLEKVIIFSGATWDETEDATSGVTKVAETLNTYSKELDMKSGSVVLINSNYWNPVGVLIAGIEEAKSADPNEPLIVYGYSKGGEIAQELVRALDDIGINVDLLFTIDAADGPLTFTVNREIPDNVLENINYFQRDGGLSRSRGNKNKRKDGSTKGIYNINLSSDDVDHYTIDDDTADDVIARATADLKAHYDKKRKKEAERAARKAERKKKREDRRN
ncbi:DUF6443 domain-containing protein [Winogradskyella luteola]|uniref:Type IV secretion protein Rhs n=1 Tax=Winogradskyella luteola TaxID=2828330 RepID=A0A9X1FAJ9_9FLAO|nr:DUF6443 domain-containing protein [Winogradskyella luteola]MBV7270312.1 type IV secretion protein Rhs [Winogradskyella luteola]